MSKDDDIAVADAREPWPGPPGCECDLSLRASDRCTKGGWLRCNGALAAQQAQYEKRRAQREGRGISPQQAREAMGLPGAAGLTEPWREDEFETIQSSAVVAPATPPAQAIAKEGARGLEGAALTERARKLFRPPFRFECGYVWDAAGEMVADNREDKEDAEALPALRVRGWGRIKYLPEPDKLHDETGRLIAEALTKGWPLTQRSTPSGEETSKAERGGDGGDDSATPLNRLRDARETPMREEGDESLGIPQTVGAQAGDQSQSSAIGSASPSNVSPGQPRASLKRGCDEEVGAPYSAAAPTQAAPTSGELERKWKYDGSDGGHKYDEHGTSDCGFNCGAWAGPFRSGAPDGIDPLGSCPKNPSGESGAGATIGVGSTAPVPDELCDIDDLPDCLVGGVHQLHCRLAGKPVTNGGNP